MTPKPLVLSDRPFSIIVIQFHPSHLKFFLFVKQGIFVFPEWKQTRKFVIKFSLQWRCTHVDRNINYRFYNVAWIDLLLQTAGSKRLNILYQSTVGLRTQNHRCTRHSRTYNNTKEDKRQLRKKYTHTRARTITHTRTQTRTRTEHCLKENTEVNVPVATILQGWLVRSNMSICWKTHTLI